MSQQAQEHRLVSSGTADRPVPPVVVAEAFLDGLHNLDITAMAAVLADEFVLELPAAPPGMPRELIGKPAFEQFFTAAKTMWRHFGLTTRGVYATDQADTVFLEYESDATNLDGSLYINTYLSKATIRDGKIIRYREMFDAEPVIRGLAAMNQPQI